MSTATWSAPPGSAENEAGAYLEDYDAVRRGVGAVPVGRDVVRLAGVDALSFLQGQVSQDVATLAEGESAESLVLTPQGKLDALVRITRLGPEVVVLDVEGGFGEALVARLGRFKLRVKATVELLDWRCVALRGPGAGDAVAGGGPGAGTVVAVPFRCNGVDGLDLLGPSPSVPAGVRVCGADAWLSRRVEAGIASMGAELDEHTIAAEAGLLDRTVSFTKGCYTGQELVARLDARGNKVARHLRGLVLGPQPRDAPPVVAGSELVADDAPGAKSVGTVTSAAWSPALGCHVALGYVRRAVEPGSLLQVRTGGTAEVRTLPLVPAD